MNNITDWRAIDTSTPDGLRELNAVIARRLGWRVIAHSLNEVNPTKGEMYLLVAPHERAYSHDDYLFLIKMGGDYAKRRTSQEAWLDAPEYTTDANAALALAFDTGYKITLETTRDPYTGKRVWLADIDTISYVETCTADTPALAVCLAYLAYTDAQAAAAGGKREAGE